MSTVLDVMPPSRRAKAQPKTDATFEPINFQVALGFTAQVDAAAAAMGMNRSSYIRMAIVRQMAADRRGRDEGAA